MINTHDNRLLMTTQEIADSFGCSYAYAKNIVDRFDFERHRFKDRCKNRAVYIEINENFISTVKEYLQMINTYKAYKIIDKINNL